MRLDRLLDNLSLAIEPFALCEVATGCELPVEPVPSATLHFVMSGSGVVRYGSRETPFAPKNLIVVPPGLDHVVVALDSADPLEQPSFPEGLERKQALGLNGEPDLRIACGRVTARFGDGPKLFARLHEPLVVDFTGTDQMDFVFSQLLTESITDEAGSLQMMTALMNRCLVLTFRELCTDGECPLPWLSALEDSGLGAAMDAMVQRPGANHSLESLAEIALMSRTTFAAEFKAQFGTPPMTFLREVRLRKAAELLRESNIGTAAVASRVGFSSRAHFATAFREFVGQTPGEYRKHQL